MSTDPHPSPSAPGIVHAGAGECAASVAKLPARTRDEIFQDHIIELELFIATHGRTPSRSPHSPAFNSDLATWVFSTRSYLTQSNYPAARRIAFERVLLQVTAQTSNIALGQRRLAQVEAVVARLGTCLLLPHESPEVDFSMTAWMGEQRYWLSKNRISSELQRRLEALPDWTWDKREASWRTRLRANTADLAGVNFDALDTTDSAQRWLRQQQLSFGSLHIWQRTALTTLAGWSPVSAADRAASERRWAVAGLLDNGVLTAREQLMAARRVLDARPAGLTELGAQMGISREAARQLECRLTSMAAHPVLLCKLSRGSAASSSGGGPTPPLGPDPSGARAQAPHAT